MSPGLPLALLAGLLCLLPCSGLRAADADAAAWQESLDVALVVHQEAEDAHCQWTATEDALVAARKAAAAGDFAEATRLARHAAELARASLAQNETEKTAWTRAVLR